MRIEKYRIMLAISAIMVIVFAGYSNTINYANAVISVQSITLPVGGTSRDVTWKTTGSTNSEAWIIGSAGGQAYVWHKPSNTNTIDATAFLNGSSSPLAVEFVDDLQHVFAVTTNKLFRISSTTAVIQEVTDASLSTTTRLIWNDVDNNLYLCFNDGYKKININNMIISSAYNDPQTNGVLDCAIDTSRGMMYVTGDSIGTAFTSEIVKIRLSDNVQLDAFDNGADEYHSACVDERDNEIWAVDGSNAIVEKYDSDLTFISSVATGATPRYCAIAFDSASRHIYIVNAVPNTVTIIDLDSNVVVSTPAVCDNLSTPIDAKRITTMVLVYITCNSSTNSIINDDQVSAQESQDFCVDINPLPDFTVLQCFTDLDGDGFPDQDPTTPITPFNATESGYTIGCQIGLIDCKNPNPQTNGVGYFYLLFLIIAFVGLIGYLVTWKLSDVHVMIWILGLVTCCGIAFFLKWTDGIPFFFSIVAVIAFAGVELAKQLRS